MSSPVDISDIFLPMLELEILQTPTAGVVFADYFGRLLHHKKLPLWPPVVVRLKETPFNLFVADSLLEALSEAVLFCCQGVRRSPYVLQALREIRGL